MAGGGAKKWKDLVFHATWLIQHGKAQDAPEDEQLPEFAARLWQARLVNRFLGTHYGPDEVAEMGFEIFDTIQALQDGIEAG